MPTKTKKKSKLRFVRRFLRVLVGILLFVLLLLLFIRSPWGQNIIVDKLANYVSNKTNTKVEVDNIFITFDGNLKLEGLFLNDKKGDTLIYSKSLEANLPIWDIINGTRIGVEAVEWEGLRATIERKDTVSGYNFQFLIDAFASEANTNQPIDTTTTSPEIFFRDLDLKDINFVFNDAVLGINSQYKIGELKGSFNTTNLDSIVFKANDLFVSNSKIDYKQSSPLVKSEEEAPLPVLAAKSLSIENTSFNYKDEINNLNTYFNFSDFETSNANINLKNSKYKIDEVILKDSYVKINTQSSQVNTTANSTNFSWPELEVLVNSLILENNKVDYLVNNTPIRNGVFDANALSINNLSLESNNIQYQNKKGNIDLSKFQFRESSGLVLNQLNFRGEFSNRNLIVNNLNFRTKQNFLRGDLKTSYSSINEFINAPENVKVTTSLPVIQVNLKEFNNLLPNLKNNVYVNALAKKPLKGKLFVEGDLAKISLYESNITWGKNTEIKLEGAIENSTNVNNLQLTLPNLYARTTKQDLKNFIAVDSLSINLPDSLVLKGKINGGLNNVNADLNLTSSQGNINVNGFYKNNKTIAYSADIKIDNYKINKLLQNDKLGVVTLKVNSKGEGKNINKLDATVQAEVQNFSYNNYDFKNLTLNGDVKNGTGNLTSNYKDDNLNFELESSIDLDTINTVLSADVNIIGADLGALGVIQRLNCSMLGVISSMSDVSAMYCG